MKLTIRPYQNDNDYWRIREFLREVMLLNKQRELSWHVARWDYWWWFAKGVRIGKAVAQMAGHVGVVGIRVDTRVSPRA